MNADHSFQIGNSHTICEDYAISGLVENGGAYAIVSDGCSSSTDTDFGSRVLALSTKKTLSTGGINMDCSTFGKTTIDNLKGLKYLFPLHPTSLDATLLALWVKDNEYTVNIYGDGVFFHKTSTTLRIIHIDFDSNTPAYLSYHLDEERKKNYDTVNGLKNIIDRKSYINPPQDIGEDIRHVSPFLDVSFKGIVEPGDIIGVCSDGVNSFQKADVGINWSDVIKQITDFKSLPGVFVQRRLGFLKRQWVKDQTTHYDDLSVAAIVI
jgi:hypothetical protein